MPKLTMRVILKSGAEFTTKCDKFTLTKNGFGQVTGYNIEGISENKPVYLDFEQVAAIVRRVSDETGEEDNREIEKEVEQKKIQEIKIKCPYCKGENTNAIVFGDIKNKEYFVYCPVCKIETIETYTSKAKAVKAFEEGKNKGITEPKEQPRGACTTIAPTEDKDTSGLLEE